MDTSAYLVPKATSKRRPTSFTGSLDTTLTAEAAIDPAALATAAVATYGLWSAAMTPAVANDPDADAVELGMKFTATTAGSITGLRFYKGAQNTGTHTGSLWTSTGARLGTVTFTNETTSGWQTATFVTPITITANTTYVASYFAPKGHYSVNDGYFSSTYRNGPLTAPAGANGVYTYSRTSAFPTGSYQSSNYWVDVVFQPTTPIANQAPTATNDSGFSTTAGMALRLSTGVLLANDNDPDGDTLTVTGVTAASGGTVTLDAAAKEVVFTPNAGFTGTASFSYAVSDGYGATASASVGVSVNPAGTANAIVLENRKAGSPRGEWDITGGGSTNIQGFAADMSVNLGQTVDFKIKTDSTNYRIDIYRLGYYGGDGARKVGTLQKQLGAAQVQPNAIVDGATGLVDAGNWNVSASWAVPGDAVSGVYVAKLVRQDGVTGASHIPFIVRNDAAKGGVVFQTADTTWQAYNTWGGKSLYYDAATGGRAYKVSYNRPFTNRGDTTGTTGPRDFLFDSEYPMIRWLEANGYDVSYISGLDTDRNGSFLLNNKLFLSVGHDEYWSGQQRANVEAARDAGVNLAFLAGNEMFWKTRWEAAIDGSGKPYRTLVCYKETHADAKIDPSAEWTGT
ncbi:MAG TPA: N,N-dimethylformamidase beta subunit family domain-containing protein, partial [Azospirillaceae bacterium]|nr:N,N-dimethylformamidase beta subunit family domain-containing protein [Azospirillaceae bacterium]